MNLVYSEETRPARPLVPNRKRKPKMVIVAYHVSCTDCGGYWKTDWFGGLVKLRREIKNHECRRP